MSSWPPNLLPSRPLWVPQSYAVRRWLQRVNFAPVSSMRFKGYDAPWCYYSFLIFLSSHLTQNNTLKPVWSFKGSVNSDGKIWMCLLPLLNRPFSYFACFCTEERGHNWTSLLKRLPIEGSASQGHCTLGKSVFAETILSS